MVDYVIDFSGNKQYLPKCDQMQYNRKYEVHYRIERFGKKCHPFFTLVSQQHLLYKLNCVFTLCCTKGILKMNLRYLTHL